MGGRSPNRAAATPDPDRARRGGVLLKLLALLTMLAAGTALAWMLLLPGVVVDHLERHLGGSVELASLAANPLTGRVEARDVKLVSPRNGPHAELHIETLEARVRPLSLRHGAVDVAHARLTISRLLVPEDLAYPGALDTAVRSLVAGLGREFRIGQLDVTLERVSFSNIAAGAAATRDWTPPPELATRSYREVTALAPVVQDLLSPAIAASAETL